jgi:hypothetical protein
MEISGDVHAPVVLPLRKEPPVSTGVPRYILDTAEEKVPALAEN